MASKQDLSIFVLGATGYIGGAVAVHFKTVYQSAKFVAYTRSANNAPALEKAGFKPLIGTGDKSKDDELITTAIKNADVVLNTADADDLHLTKVILAAFEKHDRKNGLPILIHTSGTGLLSAKPLGNVGGEESEKIWDDNVLEDIKGIAPSAPHRDVDLAIFEAAEKRHSINYIIAPSTIYAPAPRNPVHKISQQIISLIRVAIKRRQTVYGGEGKNIWTYVHIDDLADLYQLVLDKALVERATGVNSTLDPFERFYFASVGEHTFGDVARKLAPLLHKRGLVDNAEAKSVPVDEVSNATVTNSRARANRAFKDGWQPKAPHWSETLEADIDGVLEKDGK